MPSALTQAGRFVSSATPARVALATVSACALPALLVIGGLFAHAVLTPAAGKSLPEPLRPRDWVLGAAVNLPGVGWPFFQNRDYTLLILIGGAAAVTVAGVLARVGLRRLAQRQALAAECALRERLHEQTLKLGAHDTLTSPAGSALELFTQRADETRRGLALRWELSPWATLSVALLFGLALAVDFLLAVLAGLLLVLLAGLLRGLYAQRRHEAKVWFENARVQEEKLRAHLRLAPLTMLYSLPQALGEPFADCLRRYQVSASRAASRVGPWQPYALLAVFLAAAVLLLVIGLSERAPASALVTLAAVGLAAWPLALRLNLPEQLAPAEAAADAILTYLDRWTGALRGGAGQTLGPLRRELRLDGVTLANREGRRLFDELSLAIPAGKRVGLASSDPQAALALAGLLVRFYDPASGRVLVDDCDIGQVTIESLRQQTALVTADTTLFTASVSDNIRCGHPQYTAQDVTEAAKAAQAFDFVQNLPNGFDTVVGEGETRLEHDQAFRVALARALLHNPSLLIVEEPMSDVSEATGAVLDKALDTAAAGRTLIVLPNRLTTLRRLEKVYLLHEGKLLEEGAHGDLLERCPLYRHLNYLRFNTFRNVARA